MKHREKSSTYTCPANGPKQNGSIQYLLQKERSTHRYKKMRSYMGCSMNNQEPVITGRRVP